MVYQIGLSSFILCTLTTLFYKVLPYLQPIDPDSFGMKALKFSFVPLMNGSLMVLSGVTVAPQYRKATSIALGIIYIYLVLYAAGDREGWPLIKLLSVIVGIAFGTIVGIGLDEKDKNYVTNPVDKNQETVKQVQAIAFEHQVDSFLASVLRVSKA